MMIHLSLGLAAGLRPGQAAGGSAPAPSAVLTPILRDRAIFDSGFHRGLSAAPVLLTGSTDAPDGAVIEARAVDVETPGGIHTTGWVALGTAAAGAFLGTFQAPRAPCWYRAEVRVQGSAAPAAQMANRFAAGHVWALWEQSNVAKIVTDMPGSPAALYDALSHEGDVQVSWRASGGGAAGAVVSVTEANKNAAPVTPTVVAMANAWSACRPGEKLMIAFQTQTGTSPWDAYSTTAEDPAGSRDWTEDAQIHAAAATSIGTRVGVAMVLGWTSTTIGYGGNIPGNHLIAMTGHNAAGTLIDVDAIWGGHALPRIPVGTMANGGTVDATGQALGGVYDMRYTRVGWVGPHGADIDPAWMQPAASYASIAAMPAYATVPEGATFAAMAANAKAIWKAANHPEVFDWPGHTAGAYRPLSDPLHFELGDRDGRQRYGSILMHTIMHMIGLHSYGMAVLNGRYDGPSGAWADFWITGKNLTTERRRRAAAGTLNGVANPIPAIAPHRCEVMGWVINDKPAANAVIMTASGHPVLPDGQTFCRVYPNSGAFTSADSVHYGYGPLPGYLVAEDYDHRVYLNWLVADLGQPAAVLPAVPVQFQQGVALPTTLTAPNLFRVSGTTHMRTASNAVPPGTTAYYEAKFRMEVLTGRSEIMGLGNDGSVRVLANGDVELRDGATGSAVAAGACPVGVFRTLGFIIDRNAAGSPKLQIIDVANGGAVLATDTSITTGNFNSGRVSFFHRQGSSDNPCNATFEYARIWQNTATPTGNPAYAVEATAAAPHYATPYGTLQFGSAPNNVPPADGAL